MTIAQALPWWQALPDDFNRIPCPTPLDAREPFKVRATAGLDNVLRTGLAFGALASLAPTFMRPGRFAEDWARLDFHRAVADRGNVAEAFPAPPRNVTFSHRPAPLLGYSPRGINTELVGFYSPYQALDPALREAYARHHHSHQVVALEWPLVQPAAKVFLGRRGLGLRDLRHAQAVHCPLTWQPVIDPDRLLIIGGAGDRFTSPRYIQLLHEHWAGSHLHWFPGNHVLHLRKREYLDLMLGFMDRCTEQSRQAG